MAIREYSEDTTRTEIACVGEMPDEDGLRRFKEREFVCRRFEPDELSDETKTAALAAVIWTQDSEKLLAAPRSLVAVAPRLLDSGVSIFVRVAEDAQKTAAPRKVFVDALVEAKIPFGTPIRVEWERIPEARRERERAFLSPLVHILVSSIWTEIANFVCNLSVGLPIISELKYDEDALLQRFGAEGHPERRLLLQRAFWNCSELKLAPLDGGLSGAPVFKAHAALEAGLVHAETGQSYPSVCFVKIGPRKKIVDEYDKYRQRVFDYLPFHLAPRLRLDRCNLGSSQGILVGDFVEDTESLVVCARSGRSGHAISNLFDKTLGGWRKPACRSTARSIGAYLQNKWLGDGPDGLIELPASRASFVRELGGKAEVAPLKAIFDRVANSYAYVSPAHGDMHATNVLVRHGDAILIDFEKLEPEFPLTFDPASLEGGLLVEGFIDDLKEKKVQPDELMTMIERLYEPVALVPCRPTFCPPGDPAEWYYTVVNQIRTLSWAAEYVPGQYALTLGLCLIRKGCNPDPSLARDEPNALRAIAFCLGERILLRVNQES